MWLAQLHTKSCTGLHSNAYEGFHTHPPIIRERFPHNFSKVLRVLSKGSYPVVTSPYLEYRRAKECENDQIVVGQVSCVTFPMYSSC